MRARTTSVAPRCKAECWLHSPCRLRALQSRPYDHRLAAPIAELNEDRPVESLPRRGAGYPFGAVIGVVGAIAPSVSSTNMFWTRSGEKSIKAHAAGDPSSEAVVAAKAK